MPTYGTDLAYIHDRGFSRIAEQAAQEIVLMLRRAGIRRGLILDLGCGSGRSSNVFSRSGYEVLGIDSSAAMIRIARMRAPLARFRVLSLERCVFPPCCAVAAVGEVINYLARPSDCRRVLARLARALEPDGLMVLDLRMVPRAGTTARWTRHRSGRGWFVVADTAVRQSSRRLIRTITSLRRVAGHWRRAREAHRQRVYTPGQVADWIRQAGLAVRIRRTYGGKRGPPHGVVLIARKRQRRH